MSPIAGHVIRMEAVKEYSDGAHGVWALDFGDSQTIMPMMDAACASWRTVSCCILMTKPQMQFPHDISLPNPAEPLRDYGNGLRMILVELPHFGEADLWRDALEKATKKLLEVPDGQQVDAARSGA